MLQNKLIPPAGSSSYTFNNYSIGQAYLTQRIQLQNALSGTDQRKTPEEN